MAKRKGYGRVSSKGQEKNGNSLEDQERQLKEAGCDEIVLEAYTGTKMERPKFPNLLEELRQGTPWLFVSWTVLPVLRGKALRLLRISWPAA